MRKDVLFILKKNNQRYKRVFIKFNKKKRVL